MGTKCSGYKKTAIKKIKANWVGDRKKLFRQLMVSLKSYVVNPFVKKHSDATQAYFSSIYSKQKVDDLIFDGDDASYLAKAALILEGKRYDKIYDCGCGGGSFLSFATQSGIEFEEYVGIDFAISESKDTPQAKFIKGDILELDFSDTAKERLVVLSNVACYLSDEKLKALMSKAARKGTTLLIVDPVPGLFWDATFEGVKLFYRTPRRMSAIAEKAGYSIEQYAKDYLCECKNAYLFPLSYAATFRFV